MIFPVILFDNLSVYDSEKEKTENGIYLFSTND